MSILIYQGLTRPAYSVLENRIEFFNEFIVALCSFFTIYFTDWVPTEELKYIYGWSFCAMILLQVIVNMYLVTYYSLRRIYHVIIRLKGKLL